MIGGIDDSANDCEWSAFDFYFTSETARKIGGEEEKAPF